MSMRCEHSTLTSCVRCEVDLFTVETAVIPFEASCAGSRSCGSCALNSVVSAPTETECSMKAPSASATHASFTPHITVLYQGRFRVMPEKCAQRRSDYF